MIPIRARWLYRRFFNRQGWRNFVVQKVFYREVFEQCGLTNDLVFDIGANSGFKTEVFLSLGKTIVAFEPDRTSFVNLQERLGKVSRIRLVNEAVSDSVGEATFYFHEEGSAYNTLEKSWVEVLEQPKIAKTHQQGFKFLGSYPVKTTTLAQAIKTYGNPGYIKIDVEGHELAVIRGLSGKFRVLSFEANLPLYLDETLEIVTFFRERYPTCQFQVTLSHLHLIFPDWASPQAMVGFLKTTREVYFEVFVRV